jgi:DNA-binding LacI/PurR family transcriptional regulator/signal transduction histidine kinase/ActR/RegA family two-component response regulator
MCSAPDEVNPRSARKNVNERRGRPTVALLLDYMNFLDGAYQLRLTEAFHAAASKLDLNLNVFFGRGLDEPNPASKAHNSVFELIDANSTDGVIVVSTVLAAASGLAGVRRWIQRYEALPLVSVGADLAGVASVTIDNSGSTAALVEHLIRHHRRRRIAFLGGTEGNPEGDARLSGYREALARHGLPFEPALVEYGEFLHAPACQATNRILDMAGRIDALVAANDTMAFAALDVLRDRGLLVPSEVVVTGFDDVPNAGLGNTALTTVAQPFEAMAERSLQLILRQIDGAALDILTELPAEVRIRRSCGCGPGPAQARAARAGAHTSLEYLREHEPRIAARVHRGLSRIRGLPTDAVTQLLRALRAELSDRAGTFLSAVESLLRDTPAQDVLWQALHDIIDGLRSDFHEVADVALDDVWFRALSRVAHGTMGAAVEHRLKLDNEYLKLLATADRMSVALDLPVLREAMTASLTSIGIHTAFVSHFLEGDSTRCRALVNLVDGAAGAASASPFLASALRPPEARGAEKRRTLIVGPLVFETHWLGVACFEYTPGANGYQLVRDQLAAALGHVTLQQEVLSKTMLHERSQQERSATARRLEALSVLAGGVAHDLNNTLGPLVALPDVITRDLRQLEAAGAPAELLEQLYADVRCVKAAGLRAAQTITDLLTLGRQGRARREPLELSRAVDVGLWEPLRALAREHPQVQVRLELHPAPLVISASEAHLVRALTNLVRNAAEAIAGRGEILVRTELVRLTEPYAGYETIAAGDYAVVRVSDSGGGISPQELERVFEPFFSRKRLGEQSGSGLGLAIVHGVAKEHDGYVDLQSAVGGGTTFSLFFPRSYEAERLKSVPAPAPRRRARILLIEDEPLQVRAARRVLSSLGHDVEALPSGERALDVLERAGNSAQGAFDLLLIDVMLNEQLDGVQLLRQIRRSFPEQKAVLMSGQRHDDARGEIPVGVVWLDKPYTTERLAKAVEEALAEPDLAPAAQ